MANEVLPVYGPAPPPDSYDTTSPLLLYSSHRNQRRASASVFKRAALASKRKVRAVTFKEVIAALVSSFVSHSAVSHFILITYMN
jgi:hypothetical protein